MFAQSIVAEVALQAFDHPLHGRSARRLFNFPS